LGNKQYLGHWGLSNANGQAGGFQYARTVEENSGGVKGKTLYQASRRQETNRDGSFKYGGGFGVNANEGNGSQYSDIELYLMGLKSEQELRDANFQLDVYSGNEYEADAFKNGYFYSTAKKTYTIDDIVARNGKRVPDASVSQKQFKVLTVVITPETADKSFRKEIMRDINWLAGDMKDKTYSGLYNFRQATGDRGSLIVNDLIRSLKEPVIDNIDLEIIVADEPGSDNSAVEEKSQGENSDIDAYIYPNPTTGKFTLEYEAQTNSYAVTLSYSNGKVIMRRTVSDKPAQFDLSGFPAGVYLVTIEDGAQKITKRIIKN
jgi:hypothetical protein